jgi:hypothetical protein
MVTGWDVTVRVNADNLNPCNVKLPLRITHGRSSTDVQPEASTCTFAWAVGHVPAGRPQPAILPPGSIGDTLTVRESGEPQFAGRITDLQAVETGGLVVEWLVTAIGAVARLGRIPVVLSRDVEADTNVVWQIASAAGVGSITHTRGDPGVFLAADAIDRDALSALHEVCQSAGGLLWSGRNGRIVYETAKWRSRVPNVILPCSGIGDGVDWTVAESRIIHHVTCTWREGTPPNTTEHQVTIRDDPSIAAHGLWHRDAASICASEADALALGATILGRNKALRWVIPDVILYPALLDAPTRRALRQLEISDGVLLPIEIEPTPTPGALTSWTVEGWVKEWSAGPPWGYRMQLAVSDRGQRDILRTWDEVALGTWDTWAAGTWMNMLIKEPTP